MWARAGSGRAFYFGTQERCIKSVAREKAVGKSKGRGVGGETEEQCVFGVLFALSNG